MQRVKLILPIFFLILLSTLVLAQTNTSANLTSSDIKDSTSKLDSKLDQNVKIPETLQILTRIIFGINSSEKVTISAFIILLFIWAWIFVIVAEALKFTPFFKGKLIWLGALIITLIIASTKTILLIARFWLDMGSSFKLLEGWSTGAFVVSIMGLILALILTLFLKDWVDKKFGKMKRNIDNEELEKGIKVIRESAKELEED